MDDVKFESPVSVKLSNNTIKNCLNRVSISMALKEAYVIDMYRDKSDNRTVWVCSKIPKDNPATVVFFEELK